MSILLSDSKEDGPPPLPDAMSITIHAIGLDELEVKLGTNLRVGLTDEAAKKALTKYGTNTMSHPMSIRDAILTIKIVLAVFSFVAWGGAGWYWSSTRGTWNVVKVLVGVLTASYIFSSWRDYRSNKLWHGLDNALPVSATVFRGGKHVIVPCYSLVPGDIVELIEGKVIPADCRMISISADPPMMVNNARLTGISSAVPCTTEPTSSSILESHNVVFATTKCVQGAGRGVVLYTGDSTFFGRFLRAADHRHELGVPFRRLVYREVMRAVFLSISAVFSGVLCFGIGLNVPKWIAYIHDSKLR